jgi:hypothetical protein
VPIPDESARQSHVIGAASSASPYWRPKFLPLKFCTDMFLLWAAMKTRLSLLYIEIHPHLKSDLHSAYRSRYRTSPNFDLREWAVFYVSKKRKESERESTHLWGQGRCGVGDSVACLETRLGREEPQACSGSLCELYRENLRATILNRHGSRKRTSHTI